MDKLYAPWRDRYVHQVIKGGVQGSCVFCDLFKSDESDEQKFILFKDASVAVVLNIYPYNGGHLLVVPKSHVAEFDLVISKDLSQLMAVSAQSMKIVQEILNAQGINFGANFGQI